MGWKGRERNIIRPPLLYARLSFFFLLIPRVANVRSRSSSLNVLKIKSKNKKKEDEEEKKKSDGEKNESTGD